MLHWDASGYYYQSVALAHGQLPFLDFVENKNPGIYYLLLPIAYVFQWNLSAPLIYFTIINMFNLVLLALLLKYFIGKGCAWYVSIFWVVVTYSTFVNVQAPFMIVPELPELTFLLLGILLALSKKPFISGLFFGLGFLIKQLSITSLLLGLILVYLTTSEKNKKIRSFSGLILGFLLPVGFFVVLSLHQGWFSEWIYYAYQFNQNYSKEATVSVEFFDLIKNILSSISVKPTVFLALLYPLTFIKISKNFAKRKVELILIAFLFITGVTKLIVVPGLHPKHYFDLLPALWLMSGIVFYYVLKFISNFANKRKQWLVTIIYSEIILLLVIPISLNFRLLTDGWGKRNVVSNNAMLSLWIKNNTSSADKILVWGWEREIYLYSHRFSASRFDGNVLISNNQFDQQRQIEILQKDIEKNQPAIIVVQKNPFFRYYPKLLDNYSKYDLVLPNGEIYNNVFIKNDN